MSISRSDGYRRAQGKEGPGLDSLESFMLQTIGVSLRRIENADENYQRGDFEAPSGETIECKRQPIDPNRYRNNFVEVCEATRNPRHEGGYAELVSILDLAKTPRVDLVWSPFKTKSAYRLDAEPRLSISIHTFVRAAIVGYVNPDKHIYLYRSSDLLGAIRQAATSGPLARGAGNSNADTFAVFVPVADWRWAKCGEHWTFGGAGDEPEAVRGVRAALRMPLA